MLLTRSAVSPIDFAGLRILDYTAGHSFDASVAVVEVPPGARHAAAWSRRSDKYYLLSAGQLLFVLDGESHLMKAGDFCVVKRGQTFSYSNQNSDLATLVLVHTPRFDLKDEVFVDA